MSPGPVPGAPPPGYEPEQVVSDALQQAVDEKLDDIRAALQAEAEAARQELAYREAQTRAMTAARGGEEVLSERTDLDDTYLDGLQVAITPPNGPLVTRLFRFTDEVAPGDPPVPADVVGRIALWKVEVRGDDVNLLIEEVRRLRTALRKIEAEDHSHGPGWFAEIARDALGMH